MFIQYLLLDIVYTTSMIVSKKGRTLRSGCVIGESLRCIIIDYIVTNGGDIQTGFFPGSFASVANHFKLSRSFFFQNFGTKAVKKDLSSLDGKEEITHVT